MVTTAVPQAPVDNVVSGWLLGILVRVPRRVKTSSRANSLRYAAPPVEMA
jgi:hypothetical protein